MLPLYHVGQVFDCLSLCAGGFFFLFQRHARRPCSWFPFVFRQRPSNITPLWARWRGAALRRRGALAARRPAPPFPRLSKAPTSPCRCNKAGGQRARARAAAHHTHLARRASCICALRVCACAHTCARALGRRPHTWAGALGGRRFVSQSVSWVQSLTQSAGPQQPPPTHNIKQQRPPQPLQMTAPTSHAHAQHLLISPPPL